LIIIFLLAEDSNGFKGWPTETDESDLEWSEGDFFSYLQCLVLIISWNNLFLLYACTFILMCCLAVVQPIWIFA